VYVVPSGLIFLAGGIAPAGGASNRIAQRPSGRCRISGLAGLGGGPLGRSGTMDAATVIAELKVLELRDQLVHVGSLDGRDVCDHAHGRTLTRKSWVIMLAERAKDGADEG
jgi:hypothetical protein